MSAGHTPGPWWPARDGNGNWTVRTYGDNCPWGVTDWEYSVSICRGIGDHNAQRTSGNEEANARLIATAPEMLEALKGAQIALERIGRSTPKNYESFKAWTAVTSAIDKATGKETAV